MLYWIIEPSGLGWDNHKAANFIIKPDNLDTDEWSLFVHTNDGVNWVYEGGLSDCKAHAVNLFNLSA